MAEIVSDKLMGRLGKRGQKVASGDLSIVFSHLRGAPSGRHLQRMPNGKELRALIERWLR